MIRQKNPLYLLLISIALMSVATAGYAQTVYTTNTGTKYHTSSCRYLSKSKISITLKDAKNQNYEACKVCKPTSTVNGSNGSPQKATSASSTNSSPSNSTQSGGTTQCTGITQSGKRCSRMTKSTTGKCYQH